MKITLRNYLTTLTLLCSLPATLMHAAENEKSVVDATYARAERINAPSHVCFATDPRALGQMADQILARNGIAGNVIHDNDVKSFLLANGLDLEALWEEQFPQELENGFLQTIARAIMGFDLSNQSVDPIQDALLAGSFTEEQTYSLGQKLMVISEHIRDALQNPNDVDNNIFSILFFNSEQDLKEEITEALLEYFTVDSILERARKKDGYILDLPSTPIWITPSTVNHVLSFATLRQEVKDYESASKRINRFRNEIFNTHRFDGSDPYWSDETFEARKKFYSKMYLGSMAAGAITSAVGYKLHYDMTKTQHIDQDTSEPSLHLCSASPPQPNNTCPRGEDNSACPAVLDSNTCPTHAERASHQETIKQPVADEKTAAIKEDTCPRSFSWNSLTEDLAIKEETKTTTVTKDALIVIDMQPDFSGSETIVQNVLHTIQEAIRREMDIIFTEYKSPNIAYDKIYAQLRDVVRDYPHVITIQKATDSAYVPLMHKYLALKKDPDSYETIWVCGAYLTACVMKTTSDLSMYVPSPKKILLTDSTIGIRMEKTMHCKQGQDCWMSKPCNWEDENCVSLPKADHFKRMPNVHICNNMIRCNPTEQPKLVEKDALIVIDMQPTFCGSETILQSVLHTVQAAIQKEMDIIFMEYWGADDTYTELKEAVRDYPHFFTVHKATDSGYVPLVHQYSTDLEKDLNNYETIWICGAYLNACVMKTTSDLSKYVPSPKKILLTDSTVGRQMDGTMRCKRGQECWLKEPCKWKDKNCVSLPKTRVVADHFKRMSNVHMCNNMAHCNPTEQARHWAPTPLVEAVAADDRHAVEAAFKEGASSNSMDTFGDTLLHYAAFADKARMIKLLVEHGAEIDQQNNHGETPLIKAIKKGNCVATAALLFHGAKIITQASPKASDLFVINGVEMQVFNPSLQKLLVRYGATDNN